MHGRHCAGSSARPGPACAGCIGRERAVPGAWARWAGSVSRAGLLEVGHTRLRPLEWHAKCRNCHDRSAVPCGCGHSPAPPQAPTRRLFPAWCCAVLLLCAFSPSASLGAAPSGSRPTSVSDPQSHLLPISRTPACCAHQHLLSWAIRSAPGVWDRLPAAVVPWWTGGEHGSVPRTGRACGDSGARVCRLPRCSAASRRSPDSGPSGRPPGPSRPRLWPREAGPRQVPSRAGLLGAGSCSRPAGPLCSRTSGERRPAPAARGHRSPRAETGTFCRVAPLAHARTRSAAQLPDQDREPDSQSCPRSHRAGWWR